MAPSPLKGCSECRDNPDVVTTEDIQLCTYHANVHENNTVWPRWKPFTIGQTVKINHVPKLWASPLRFHRERIGIVLKISKRSYNQIIYALAIIENGKVVDKEAWFEHECLTLVSDITKKSAAIALEEMD